MTVALITGCSSGIGLAAAAEFARQGCTVVATLRNLDRAGPLREALADAGSEADVRPLDVADDESVRCTCAAIVADHGVIDVVVSNAGIGIDGTTEELTIDDFRDVLRNQHPGQRASAARRHAGLAPATGWSFHRRQQHGRGGRQPVQRCVLRIEVRPRGIARVIAAGGRPARNPSVARRARAGFRRLCPQVPPRGPAAPPTGRMPSPTPGSRSCKTVVTPPPRRARRSPRSCGASPRPTRQCCATRPRRWCRRS